jgi:uncharacterized DUF497 family protein
MAIPQYRFMAIVGFDRDPAEERTNRLNHGIDFQAARLAFADQSRLTAEDAEHGSGGKRYFRFGRSGSRVLTVRSAYRAGAIRIFGAGFWCKGWQTRYRQDQVQRDGPGGSRRAVEDLAPPPGDPAFREEGVKITLAPGKRSVEFLKREARKHNTQYQRMIRRLIGADAERYAQLLAPRSTGRPPARLRPRGGRRLP